MFLTHYNWRKMTGRMVELEPDELFRCTFEWSYLMVEANGEWYYINSFERCREFADLKVI